MATLQRNGTTIYYEIHGSGSPLLFSHGYSATAQMWQAQVPVLSREYQFITWDMRGHGQTDSPAALAQYSREETVADIAAVLDTAGAREAVIGGLSLGGYMTLAFYAAHPERCRALILCDTGPGYRNPVSREQWNETSEQRAVKFETQGLAALGNSPEVERTRGGHRSAQGLANAARGMLRQHDAQAMELLPNITVPVLIIIGENDKPFLAAADVMAANIPGARKVVIPNAGHASNIDQPERFNEAVLDFLTTIGLPKQASAGA